MLQRREPLTSEGEDFTNTDLKRQEFEQELTRSNWRSFHASQDQDQEDDSRGTGRNAHQSKGAN